MYIHEKVVYFNLYGVPEEDVVMIIPGLQVTVGHRTLADQSLLRPIKSQLWLDMMFRHFFVINYLFTVRMNKIYHE